MKPEVSATSSEHIHNNNTGSQSVQYKHIEINNRLIKHVDIL